MREYKFRAWSKSQNRIVYRDECVMILNSDGSLDIRKTEYWDMDFEEVNDDIVLMQYTGLKDKNGREGYQKDIWLYHGVRYTVEWDEENAGFYLKHPSDRATIDDHIPISEFPNGEVIGNVWEHPHLLKGGDPT